MQSPLLGAGAESRSETAIAIPQNNVLPVLPAAPDIKTPTQTFSSTSCHPISHKPRYCASDPRLETATATRAPAMAANKDTRSLPDIEAAYRAEPAPRPVWSAAIGNVSGGPRAAARVARDRRAPG